MKTRKEILEQHHDSALAKLLEDEINLESLKNRAKETKPGADFDELQNKIGVFEKRIERVKEVLKIIDNMYAVAPDKE